MRRLFPVFCVFFGCQTELDLDGNAAIVCRSDQECPDGWICIEGSLGDATCAEAFPEVAPVLSVSSFDSEQRYLTSATVELDVFDLNGSIDSPEEVRIEAEYRVSGDAPVTAPAEFDPDNPNRATGWWTSSIDVRWDGALDAVESGSLTSSESRPLTVTWRAVSDASRESRAESFDAQDVDASGDGVRESSVVTFIPEVELRFRAVDAGGLASEWVATESFQLGNETPTVELVGSVAVGTGDLVTWAINLSDSASDPVDLEGAFCRSECGLESSWVRATLVDGVEVTESQVELSGAGTASGTCDDSELARGLTRCVLSSPEPRGHFVVWAAGEDLNGELSASVLFRVRGSDAFDADPSDGQTSGGDNPPVNPRHHGSWNQAAVPSVMIDETTPP